MNRLIGVNLLYLSNGIVDIQYIYIPHSTANLIDDYKWLTDFT